MDPETIQCPFGFYAAARKEAPVYKLPNSPLPGRDVYLVTRFDLVQAVWKDWRTYSNKFGDLMGQGSRSDPEIAEILSHALPPVDTMLTQDPPLQRQYRALVTKSFGFARVEQMSEYMSRICDELIDAFIDRGTCNFFKEFAIPLPVFVIADQLGVPRTDIDKFKQWTDDAIANIGRMKGRESGVRAARSLVEMHQYFIGIIEDRRKAPRDDVISELANAKFKGERLLTMAEMLSIIQQLLVAGNETTTNTLAGGMVYILNEPGAQERFAADSSLIPNAVDEILRLEAPTKHMWRVVTADTELGGMAIPAGATVLLSYDSANRDEAKFPDGESCRFDRANAADHTSFGGGAHACVGSLLSRKEITVAYQRLFGRLRGIRIAEGHKPLRYFESILHRGYEELHLAFSKR